VELQGHCQSFTPGWAAAARWGGGALLSGCRVPTWPEEVVPHRWQINLAYLATGLDLDQAASASWRSYAG